jgi:hypothetical protein
MVEQLPSKHEVLQTPVLRPPKMYLSFCACFISDNIMFFRLIQFVANESISILLKSE